MSITNWKIETQKIVVDDKYKHLISNEFPHQLLTFDLESHISIANGLRRVLIDEVLVKYLWFELTAIDTSDRYVISDKMRDDISYIPLSQSVPMGVTFSIDESNKTLNYQPIHSGMIKASDKKTYFKPNINLGILNSDKYLKVNNIKVKSSYGFETACAQLLSLGFKPLNEINKSSLVATPTKFRFKLQSNGSMEIKSILIYAINTLIEILTNFSESLSTIESRMNMDVMVYPVDQTHTLGNIIVSFGQKLDPQIKLINYKLIHPLKNKIEINVKHANPDKLLKDSAEAAIERYRKILRSF